MPENSNLGELERGDEINSALYINMSSDRGEVYQVPFEPTVTVANYEYVKDDIDSQRISNQDVSEWVDIGSSVIINGQSSRDYQIEENRQIEADGKIEYALRVPENADPGQHYFTIRLDTKNSRNLELSYSPIIFDVSGDVERSLELQSVEAYNTQKDMVKIDFNISNTGNVAVKTERSTIEILDESGNSIEGLTFPESRIPNGESKKISISWNPVREVESSDYRLRGSIEYYTSSIEVDHDLDKITRDKIESEDIKTQEGSSKSDNSNITGMFSVSSIDPVAGLLSIGIMVLGTYILREIM